MNVRTAVLGLALTAMLGAPASAQTASSSPAPAGAAGAVQRASMTVEAVNQAAIPAHVYYGTIVRMHGTKFTLRLRDGRDVRVDASPAIKNDTYSAPLFVGKIVAVSGTIDAKGVFDAASVSRFTSIDASTPPDR